MTNSEAIKKQIAQVAPVLRLLSWADPQTKAEAQKYGVNVLPINHYSNSPSLAEIENSFEYTSDAPPYLNPDIFDPAVFRSVLEQLFPFAAEFDPSLAGDMDNPAGFFWNNPLFSFSDAMAYYCFIRWAHPSTIVEIGSGYSTLVALEAVRKNGSGTVVCVEPFPREFLKRQSSIILHSHLAQDLDTDFLNSTLKDNDILFIDSTHTVKTGSDCLHIYLRLLPAIKKNIYVHVHDVFLPFGMPKQWLLEKQIFWTEQYLLLAFLLDNPKATALYGSQYHMQRNRARLEMLMGNKYRPGGASFWFRYDGTRTVYAERRA